MFNDILKGIPERRKQRNDSLNEALETGDLSIRNTVPSNTDHQLSNITK